MIFESIALILCAYAVAIFATVAGFGISTLLIPIMAFFLDLKTVIAIVACFHLFNNIFKVRLFKQNINKEIFLYFGVPSLIFAFIGANLLVSLPTNGLKQLLAAFLLGYAAVQLFKPKRKRRGSLIELNTEHFKFHSILGGIISGFLTGVIGMGGAVRGAFLINYNVQKEVYIATSALIALVVDLARIPAYFSNQLIDLKKYGVLLIILIAVAYAGVRTGKLFVNTIDPKKFQNYVYCALVIVSILILMK